MKITTTTTISDTMQKCIKLFVKALMKFSGGHTQPKLQSNHSSLWSTPANARSLSSRTTGVNVR